MWIGGTFFPVWPTGLETDSGARLAIRTVFGNKSMAVNPAGKSYRWLLTILFGLFVIWTGLLAGIEARAFKPNPFWFCLATGLVAVAGGFLYRVNRETAAMIVTLPAAGLVLGYYLFTFVSQPEQDATVRVGLVIVAAFGQMAVLFLPKPPRE